MLRRSKNKTKDKAAEPQAEASGSGSGVVVAGDDADARELLARVMARAGHGVEQVDAPAAALDALTATPRLALLALFHGDGAVVLAQDVRAAADPGVATLPIVVVADDDPTAQAATVAGADGALTRPFHADELTGELDAVLARSPEERAASRDVAALKAED